MTRSFNVFAIALLGLFAVLFPRVDALAQDEKNKYSDDKYDFAIEVSEPWKNAPLQGYTVPGVARAAYVGSKGASIVLFVQEPGKAFDPRFLVDESAKSMEKNLGAMVSEKDVRDVDGKKAMSLVVEGKGTGGAIDGKGSVQTSQHWIAIPREKDVVVALLTSPTQDFKTNQKSFLASIKQLKIGGTQTDAQKLSK
jgi:hypothetical protein